MDYREYKQKSFYHNFIWVGILLLGMGIVFGIDHNLFLLRFQFDITILNYDFYLLNSRLL